MAQRKQKIVYVDDGVEPISLLLRLRLPALCIGLVLGVLISVITSRFEEVIAYDVRVAFFLPFIVYMAAAVGTQTEAIYSRDLKTGKARFHTYLIKESAVGLALGTLFGSIAGFVTNLWLGEVLLAWSIGISMFAAVGSAPLIALVVTEIVQLSHEDPAAGGGPIATVIQDMVSIVIYGLICSTILL